MKPHISPDQAKTFSNKSPEVQQLINSALYILDCFGIPLNVTPRRLERMAMAFLACGEIKKSSDFLNAKDINDAYAVKTREIISFVNEHFSENISSGSYDDIRRKDLKLLTLAGVVLQSNPNSATNDSTRGYSLNPSYAELLRSFGTEGWKEYVSEKLGEIESLHFKLKRERIIEKIDIVLPSGRKLYFSAGEHNKLQKLIIEELLPRYGYGAEVLYIGDTADKYLHLDKAQLEELDFLKYLMKNCQMS